MVGKSFAVLSYLLCGALIASWPTMVQWALQYEDGPLRDLQRWIEKPAVESSVGKLLVRYSWPSGIICGLLIGSTLVWWPASYASISITQYGVYGLIVVFASVLLVPCHRPLMSAQHRAAWRKLLVVVAILICLLLSFSTGIMQQPSAMLTSWHHWSAFIGPSEMMLSGARIFYDFPAQYGFGPTSLIATSCGDNCWLGMYFVVATTTLLFSLVILYVIATTNVRRLGAYAVLLVVTVLVCFFWDAYPPFVSSPRVAPSVSGLRFLPAIAMVAVLIWIDRTPRLAPFWAPVGHALYALGSLWSPESLFFVGFVWWPYFLWRQCAQAPRDQFVRKLLRAAGILLAVSSAILLGFLTVYRFRYGVLPSANAYFAHMLYPPGELPIDPLGPIWYTTTAIVLGLLLVTRLLLGRNNHLDLHRAILVLLLSYATLSYCVGRSHSNNFLNVAPFSVLILVEVLASRLKVIFKAIAVGMLVSLLGWVSTFGWSAWTATIETQRLLEFQPRQFISSFSFERLDSADAIIETFHQLNARENFASISQALAAIRAVSKDPTAVIDTNYLLLANTKPQAWSAYHGPGNVSFMPREWRREFLRRTGKRLDRSGWLVIHRDFAPEWLEDFQSVYDTTQEMDYGLYRALHFSPHK